MARFFRWVITLGVIGVAVTYGIMKAQTQSAAKDQPQYMTTPLQRGELVASFTANGTVEPEDLIDVGAQVAGRIIDFGKDKKGQEIDYGSEVEQGAVLVHIDDITYRSDLVVAEAQLNSAKANLARSRADLKQMESKCDQARRDWERAQKLGPSEELAQSSYDSYRSAYDISAANVEVGKAAIAQAEAGVQQSEATMGRAKQNLSYCTIKSPVTGVIIDRRVNIGQTVVASLNAPSLFLLAKDLRQVQIWVPVNEADIGNVHVGQPVTFTVDAFPNEKFQGKVGKIRLNASMTQNVVTFTVEVITDNSSGRLLPYLTANTIFETARHSGVLLVPSSALRWNPAPETLDGETSATKAEARATPAADAPTSATAGRGRRARGAAGAGVAAGAEGGRGGRGAGSGAPAGEAGAEDAAQGQIWVLQEGKPHAIRVKVGLNSNGETEVSSPELQEGMEVITGLKVELAAAPGARGAGANPFVPQLPRRGGRGGGGGGRGGMGGGR